MWGPVVASRSAGSSRNVWSPRVPGSVPETSSVESGRAGTEATEPLGPRAPPLALSLNLEVGAPSALPSGGGFLFHNVPEREGQVLTAGPGVNQDK